MGAIVQNGLLTLGELRRAAGCLETVLNQFFRLFPCIFKDFCVLPCRFPLRVNPSIKPILFHYLC